MSDIFIAYSRTDSTVARRLADRLRAEGWSVFMDVKTRIGRRYDQVIEDELEEASAVVVLWSVASLGSHDVRDEAKVGRDKNVLFPALIETVKPPLGYRHTQTADLIGWVGDVEHLGLAELLESLREHLNSRDATPEPAGVPDADPVIPSKPAPPAPARSRAPGKPSATG